MRMKHLFLDEAGDGTGNGTGTGGTGDPAQGADSAKPDLSQQVELLTKATSILANGLKESDTRFNQFMETFAAQQKGGDPKGDGGDGGGAPSESSDPFADLDLDKLDRKEFATTLLQQAAGMFEKALQKQLGSVDEKIGSLSQRFDSKAAQDAIGQVAASNKDFWEWSTEIKQIVKDTPNLSVDRAYKLARAENIEKASAMDKKYNPEKPRKILSFSGSGVSGKSGGAKLSMHAAALKSFDEVMGQMEKGLMGEENIV